MMDSDLAAHLVERGHRRLATWGGSEQMALEHVQVFCEAVTVPRSFTESLQGVYQDAWTSERAIITFGAYSGPRHLEMLVHAPLGLPRGSISITLFPNGRDASKRYRLKVGETLALRHELPSEGGFLVCWIEPTFQPKAYGYNDDERALGCLVQACRIVCARTIHDLLEQSMRPCS